MIEQWRSLSHRWLASAISGALLARLSLTYHELGTENCWPNGKLSSSFRESFLASLRAQASDGRSSTDRPNANELLLIGSDRPR